MRHQERETAMKGMIGGFLILLSISPLFGTEGSLVFGRFGKVSLYYENPHPSHVALFLSGDGGWNLGVVGMARELATLDTLVVGIDINHFLKEMAASKENCHYPAADLEELSKFVQMELGFPVYRTPVLVGYSSGATLVYAALVQAPANTFLGAISMGFCPDLDLSKPMCRGNGLEWTEETKGKGYNFLPAQSLERPWIALQGSVDQVCNPKSTESFAKQVPMSEIVILPKVGHGFTVPRNWMPQFRTAFSRIAVQTENEQASKKADSEGQSSPVSDLPLVEVPAANAATDLMGIIITGDGGWGVTDRGIAQRLAAQGIPVVGLNSLHYFWKSKTAETAAHDLNRILQYYSVLWNRSKVIVIGYSFGADVLPFMLNRIPEESMRKINVIAFLGLGSTADFEFHLTDWLSNRARSDARLVRPELEKLRGRKMLCFYGTEDADTLCRELDPGLAKVIALRSGHRFGKDYQPIVDSILEEAR
jgi:type IV secretory pathway VirJ component